MSRKLIICLCLVCAFASIPAAAQTVTTIASFDRTNGANPYYVTLVQGRDGNLWGTTQYGGSNSYGTVFKVSLTGALQTVYSFASATGTYPLAGLTRGVDGNFYGVAEEGGGAGAGDVFKLTPPNTVTELQYFVASNGEEPVAALTQGTDGQFYGTTPYGGPKSNGGVIFKISSAGPLTVLFGFNQYSTATPIGQLVQGSDGDFYGSTSGYNAEPPRNTGTIFKVTSTGKLTTLYTFSGPDGDHPVGGLVEGLDGVISTGPLLLEASPQIAMAAVARFSKSAHWVR
jgi:uncharacterized repeat protein (TIGR03803 family)